MCKRYYLAYGSNLNIPQMRHRCPTAKVVGTAEIRDYELLFKGSKTGSYLTIEPKKGATVPVAVFRECCRGTIEIADNATARFEHDRNFMPKYDMTDEERDKYGTSHNMFSQLLEEGLNKLAPKDKIDQYRKQMEFEKYIIESTDNVDYLLVQYDTVNWCRRNGILVGCGRGSAAGSLLLYLLGITLVDPIKYNLIFERFLLPERAGLYPSKTTIIGEDFDSTDYVELTLDSGKTIKVDIDAQLIVEREKEDKPIVIYADELQEGDNILFDNKDILFTINEL